MPNLYFVESYGAAEAAPFFLNIHGERFEFSDSAARKWQGHEFGPIRDFCLDVLDSVGRNGVVNPINLDRMEIDGQIQDVVRHGATRLWAARILGIRLPAIIDVKQGEPPENGTLVEDWRALFRGRHEMVTDNGVTRIKAKTNRASL